MYLNRLTYKSLAYHSPYPSSLGQLQAEDVVVHMTLLTRR